MGRYQIMEARWLNWWFISLEPECNCFQLKKKNFVPWFGKKNFPKFFLKFAFIFSNKKKIGKFSKFFFSSKFCEKFRNWLFLFRRNNNANFFGWGKGTKWAFQENNKRNKNKEQESCQFFEKANYVLDKSSIHI